jgi:hypothetical protein
MASGVRSRNRKRSHQDEGQVDDDLSIPEASIAQKSRNRKRSRIESQVDDDLIIPEASVAQPIDPEVGDEVDDPETYYDYDAEDPPEKPDLPDWKGDELAPLVKDLVKKKRWSKQDKEQVVSLMRGRPGFDLSQECCSPENIDVCDTFIHKFNKLLDQDPALVEVVDPVYIVFQRPVAGFPVGFPGAVPPFMVALNGSQEVWRANGASLERQYGNCRDWGATIRERYGGMNFWIFRSRPHERW